MVIKTINSLLKPFTTQIPTFNEPQKIDLLKTLWEKEKMLVTSIFSFSHNVFLQSQKEFSVYKLHLFSCLQML